MACSSCVGEAWGQSSSATDASAPPASSAPALVSGWDSVAPARIGVPVVSNAAMTGAVQRVLARTARSIGACAHARLAQGGGGRLAIHFVITTTGRATGFTVARGNPSLDPVAACITQTIARTAFPVPDNDVTTVDVPIDVDVPARGSAAEAPTAADAHDAGRLVERRIHCGRFSGSESVSTRCYSPRGYRSENAPGYGSDPSEPSALGCPGFIDVLSGGGHGLPSPVAQPLSVRETRRDRARRGHEEHCCYTIRNTQCSNPAG